MNNIIHSIHYFRQAEKKNNQSKYKRMHHDNSYITLTHPFVLYFFILLNDSYGFHIHAHHMYVHPHGTRKVQNRLMASRKDDAPVIASRSFFLAYASVCCSSSFS